MGDLYNYDLPILSSELTQANRNKLEQILNETDIYIDELDNIEWLQSKINFGYLYRLMVYGDSGKFMLPPEGDQMDDLGIYDGENSVIFINNIFKTIEIFIKRFKKFLEQVSYYLPKHVDKPEDITDRIDSLIFYLFNFLKLFRKISWDMSAYFNVLDEEVNTELRQRYTNVSGNKLLNETTTSIFDHSSRLEIVHRKMLQVGVKIHEFYEMLLEKPYFRNLNEQM